MRYNLQLRYSLRYIAAGLATISLILMAQTGIAATDKCTPLARTPMERLYCEVTNKGEGKSLPPFDDFRRNTPQIQALLLKRPAEKLGLKIPADTQATTTATATDSHSASRTQAAKPQASRKADVDTSQAKRTQREPGTPESDSCQLHKQSITCSGRQFQLVENLPNKSISPTALQATNRLQLPDWNTQEQPSEHLYLTSAYQVYIDKMMEIGLGAATMSFTRFHHNFQEAKEQNRDFQQRFADMYEYLKEDKRTMSTPKRLVSNGPEGIEYCDYLKKNLIVCDNGFHNWLYLAK
ncbi:hypothetical protein BTA51_16015 [Hahella sp. CCB-MM4]|uniref:hypothetical protein n=1 Tax=Hahella sp. (strain CCB-MM4) TaxID=1926491 RepID=UPI000B9BE688|nr:hypothetical protein [Hahella sp. CCB-MM4]OZG72246.1 hypothetical protein BTA51_16015 [Hahella sp. CCB-MM4]